MVIIYDDNDKADNVYECDIIMIMIDLWQS